jgi:hypothetical protein
MPHATDDTEEPTAASVIERQVDDDDEVISRLISGIGGPEEGFNFDRPLEPEEKADDAIDFEDISDDDLPDEEPAQGDGTTNQNGLVLENGDAGADGQDDTYMDDLFGDNNADGGDGLDDLFGDLPDEKMDVDALNADLDRDLFGDDSQPLGTKIISGNMDAQPVIDDSLAAINSEDEAMDTTLEDIVVEEDPEVLEQMRLFGQHRQRYEKREENLRAGSTIDEIPPAPQTNQELFERIWPKFDRDEVPRFGVLLPGKRAFYNGKKPLKVPKPVQPHKVSLDLEPDQERFFKLNMHQPQKRKRDVTNEYGVVIIAQENKIQKAEDESIVPEILDDNEIVGGVSVQDLRLLCEDWDNLSVGTEPSAEEHSFLVVGEDTPIDASEYSQPTKRQRASEEPFTILPIFCDDFGTFDEPELLTARIAKQVFLDLNDPSLLIDTQPQHASRAKTLRDKVESRGDSSGNVKKALESKYNFSNDDAYELLKENHSNKIRSTLGNLAIEHSLVAIKLQYPFYKVKLAMKEARSFHRPTLPFNIGTVKFEQNAREKRSKMRGREAADIYSNSKALSMADNSQMLLVEYSEEYPTTLSNFGMGSKLVNYYRRKDENDHSRPKLELGDTQVLLPQDRSPFTIFGNIDPGEMTPTFHNGMYRAPVFQHDAKQTDFLCIRSTTGTGGTKWYLRNIENLYVAGQQFPSMEVPGTHSRKVTEAAKRRLRMISWRIWKRNRDRNARGAWLSNEMIKEHLPGSDIAQNRGKMREFMAYDKVNSSWQPKNGDVVPEDATMRGWIKPEEICLLDSMQVGDRHLIDVGYNRDDGEAEVDDDDDKESQGIDQQLAPWQTTKNFINAGQGKAMLQLHGEGDPTGRGEAFSFVKTSMKGGFKAVGESIEDRLDEKRRKELGGHSYNVAKQQQAYEMAIRRIWDAQARSLSAKLEPSDVEPGVEDNEADTDRRTATRTPRTEFGTPSILGRRDDESASQYSRTSANSQSGKVLRIQRKVRNKNGKVETVEEIVHDRRVIKQYMRARIQKEFAHKEYVISSLLH